MTLLTDRLRRPYAILIAAIAAVDVTYRLLLRAPIRRSLGIEVERPSPPPAPRARAVRVPPSPRRQAD